MADIFSGIGRWGLALLLLTAGLTQAADEMRVALFDERAALLQTNLARTKIEELEADRSYKEDIEELQSIEAERQKLQERVTRDRETLSTDEQREIATRAANLQADAEHTQKKVLARQQGMLRQVGQELGPQMEKALQDVIDEDGITLLLPVTNILYAHESHNITNKVVERLNASAEDSDKK